MLRPRTKPTSVAATPPQPAAGPFAQARPAAQTRVSPAVVASVSAGGVAGACARYGLGAWWPHPPTGFPWTTFTINVTGCLLIGVLMVAVTEVWPSRKLVRPFLGSGVLGGYTTFSSYIVETQHLLDAHAAGIALTYLAATVAAALLAVYVGTALTRALISRRRLSQEAR